MDSPNTTPGNAENLGRLFSREQLEQAGVEARNKDSTAELGNVNASFDSSIPRLPLLLSYVDTTLSKVKLAPGLLHNTRFVRWDEFDDSVALVEQKLNKLPDFLLAQAHYILMTAKNAIDPEKYALQSDFDEERVAIWYSSAECPFEQGSTASTVSDGGPDLFDDDDADSTAGVGNLDDVKEKGKPAYTSCNSCDFIKATIFKALQDTLKPLVRNQGLYVVPEMKFSSEMARKYDFMAEFERYEDGPADFVNLKPDYVLTRDPTTARNLPLCAIEMKGPLSKFWKVDETEDSGSSEGQSGRPSAAVESEEENTSPTAGAAAETSEIAEDGTEERPTKRALSREELQRKVLPMPRTESPRNYSSAGLVEYYNKLFNDPKILSTESPFNERLTFFPVAQALSQGLLTDTGFCGLGNFLEFIAFRIDKEVVDGNSSLVVRVSRAYPCDAPRGSFIAKLALMRLSLVQYRSGGSRASRKKEIRELFKTVAKHFVDWKLERGQGTPPRSRRNTGGRDNPSQSGNSGGGRNHARSQSVDMESEPSQDMFSDTSSTLSDLSDMHDSGVYYDVGLTKKFREIMRVNRGIIGSGDTAFVIESVWKGERVAMKTWNEDSVEGLKAFLNEIRIYRILAARRAKVLGKGIPNLVLSRITPSQDATLVVQLVGSGLQRGIDGELYLCRDQGGIPTFDRRLSHGDAGAICTSALKSLALLHQSDVLHGDVDLRNIRVFAQGNSDKDSRWGAMWIDLGMARLESATPLEMEIERAQCMSLFPEIRSRSVISLDVAK